MWVKDQLLKKNRDIMAYLFFGVCTTLVNIVIYYFYAHVLYYNTLVSNIVAWVIAVAFAFFTNKSFVFGSKSWLLPVVCKEAIAFVMCRLATGILDMVIMVIGVDVLCKNDLIVKGVSNFFVIISNYIASKFWIFKRK